MGSALDDRVLERLLADFGGNHSFALDVFEAYEANPAEVDQGWRTYFDGLLGVAKPVAREAPPKGQGSASAAGPERASGGAERAAGVGDEGPAATTPAGAAPQPEGSAVVESLERVPAGGTAGPKSPSRALARPVLLPGDILEPIRGGAVRVVENMEASLAVPTAASVRTVPVRTLEENRRILNRARETSGQGKVSFTHIVAWAILRALDSFPRLNDAYAEVDQKPHRVQHDTVRLGIAVDVQRKDGSRTLFVPSIKNASQLAFGEFLRAFDDIVARTRKGALSPDDLSGTTVSLTNPGTVGTTASSPRLMQGQGLIVAAGAVDYSAEYRSMSPRTLGLLGISKVMTLTSTYDHRIIQGAESGLFLARIEELLRGEDGFFERLFQDLGLPHRPVRWEQDTNPPLFGDSSSREAVEKQARVLRLIHAYRVRGHLVANLDPLGARRPPHPDLEPSTYGLTIWDLDREFLTGDFSDGDRATLRDVLDTLRHTYCGTVAVEYMYIADPDRKEWLRARMESSRNRTALDPAVKRQILEKLVEAESFERFLHAKYVGHKRFSLEGGEALIPLLDRLLADAAALGLEEIVMGMPHRGRLNVLANTIGKPLAQIFSEFEGTVDPASYQGSGDVKYHLGAAGVYRSPSGGRITVSLAPNPSHLEFVNPVVEGMVRAKQDALGDSEHARVIPVLLHGDAAFAGQGIVAETMNLSGLHGYRTGGTVHVVVNNQIGFTTAPEDARSSTYCTDIAKMVHAPAFHVNGDDPEAVAHVATLALEYRQRFKKDVIIDLVCYRRWGHNETDEPSYTQPLMYTAIKAHPSVAELYGEKLVREGTLSREELSALWSARKAALQDPGSPAVHTPRVIRPAPPPLAPQAMWAQIRSTLQALGSVPDGFELHPKLASHVRRRAEILEGKGDVDWATAESLAWGTLLLEGIPVRLSGQDSGRGTFSQRHAVLTDVRTGEDRIPLNRLATAGAKLEVFDSLLSEAAVMGFEFGYSVADPRALVLWEAQFGDFMNGAQVIIDQFLASSETKWSQPSSLVLLLPHGHEGQGPEHSSARIERFLALSAEANWRVAYPSTPASYFHLLRQQGRDPVEKPLVVFTPKSLLRNPRCASPLHELAEGTFLPVLDDEKVDPGLVRRVVLSTGRLFYDLEKTRQETQVGHVGLLRVEQLYPFPAAEIVAALSRFPAELELVWAQEEPRNMGPWRFVREQFLDGCVRHPAGPSLRYVGRMASASPAPGSFKVHVAEQEAIVATALGL